MDHTGIEGPRWLLMALLFVILPTFETAADPTILTQVVENEFTGDSSGPILPYTPFDGSLGLLRAADVTVEGSLEFLIFLPPAYPPDPAPTAYQIDVRNEMEAAAYARGFGFDSNSSALLVFQGLAPRSVPIPLFRMFTYQFTVTPQTDITGLVGLQTDGIDLPPDSMDARLDHFIDTRCEENTISHQSALALSFDTLLPPGLVPLGLPVFSGRTRIAYDFIPTDELLDQVENGDFEAAGFVPWLVDGPGEASLSSPIECLQATLNHLLVLTAGSPVSVSQPVDTPAEAFDLVFDYAFPDGAGRLDVWIGNTLVDSISGSPLLIGFRTRLVSVGDPSALSQTAVPLEFEWDGPSGSRAWLDNVRLLAVPEPSAAAALRASLLALAALARARGQRRRR